MLAARQKPGVGHDPGKTLGAPPVRKWVVLEVTVGKGVTFHMPVLGLFEVKMLVWSLITQNEVEGHDSPVTAMGSQSDVEHDDNAVTALGSACVLCHAPAPSVGFVELITSPTLSPAMQRVALSHTTAVSETEQW